MELESLSNIMKNFGKVEWGFFAFNFHSFGKGK